MLLSDAVWQVDNRGAVRQVTVSSLPREGEGLPFFLTQIEAVEDAQIRFEALAAADEDAAAEATELANAMVALAAELGG